MAVAEDRVSKLLAGQLCDPEVLEADGVWLSDVAADGTEREILLGVAGEPLADRALAWAAQPNHFDDLTGAWWRS